MVDKENQPPPPDGTVRVLLSQRDSFGAFQGGELGKGKNLYPLSGSIVNFELQTQKGGLDCGED